MPRLLGPACNEDILFLMGAGGAPSPMHSLGEGEKQPPSLTFPWEASPCPVLAAVSSLAVQKQLCLEDSLGCTLSGAETGVRARQQQTGSRAPHSSR